MSDLINDDNNKIYIITSRLQDTHFGMVATWITLASLRKDELRFTFSLSKFNNSAKAILETGEFIIHEIDESDFNVAYVFGLNHSLEIDKFQGLEMQTHSSGIRVLKNSISYAYVEVVKEMETEDRIVLYCRSEEIIKNKANSISLIQSRLFKLLNNEQRKSLENKYISDCKRDEI